MRTGRVSWAMVRRPTTPASLSAGLRLLPGTGVVIGSCDSVGDPTAVGMADAGREASTDGTADAVGVGVVTAVGATVTAGVATTGAEATGVAAGVVVTQAPSTADAASPTPAISRWR